jgi:cyclopropane fatty-acyl-phospholipid synthase-like methyltransferase
MSTHPPPPKTAPPPTARSLFINGTKAYTSRFSIPHLKSTRTTNLHRLPTSTTTQRPDHAASAAPATNAYYDMVNATYERFWGTHFHYTPLFPSEPLSQAMNFYVYRLALLTNLRPGMRVLDVGCGIGGPTREVAKLVGCEVIGVTINQEQVDRATDLTMRMNLGGLVAFVCADYHDLPFPDGYFDAAVSCEAFCHARDLKVVMGEVARVVKKGARLGFTDFVMTEKFDEADAEHARVRGQIEFGNGVAAMPGVDQERKALRETGWRVEFEEDYALHWAGLSERMEVVYEDQGEDTSAPRKIKSCSTIKIPRRDYDASTNPTAWFHTPIPKPPYRKLLDAPTPPVYRPWWYPLVGDKWAMSLAVNEDDRRWVARASPRRRKLAEWMIRLMIALGRAPQEQLTLVKTIALCVDSVVEGAKMGIFSPCWMFICEKTDGQGEGIYEKMWREKKGGKEASGAT